MHWLWVIIVGSAVGAFAGAIMSPGQSRGWLGHIIAGVIGALLGEVLIGPIGPELAGMTVMPAAIGAVAVTLIMMLLIQWSRVR
ncbi:GlsB/YeaQ/YmgE family stress response membrane protein [Lactiplantibacillus paraplantarum]|uniref:GlsB/YeaQ/YmgE family stress response membrane protein n=1 Tax=Lactiplantibacillus paraplantarum TaxID=60520 RepID=UPI0005132561|nr:GlsB/YeaQ/YmgE family stress response membrane protein [Lactiplantibacillus paraplantarum]OAX75008.1 hypothetical protein A0U96_04495 [Lactiplantibacillus plantarum]ALO04138.1 hypothetical protein ASU28_07110 [Lactiplantibacillus paraplantarum]KGE74529.1 membrane protein [Lactiplantibacillus paraplantarum]MCT4457657.1 GlsB/YeaQ/YmgE family stress response membrane protein [Lactiplantibacillus paraplantarum]MCW1910239.1 GlsB/YeaQ/YmgE family stress response membrane protein [Lactiplantibacil